MKTNYGNWISTPMMKLLTAIAAAFYVLTVLYAVVFDRVTAPFFILAILDIHNNRRDVRIVQFVGKSVGADDDRISLAGVHVRGVEGGFSVAAHRSGDDRLAGVDSGLLLRQKALVACASKAFYLRAAVLPCKKDSRRTSRTYGIKFLSQRLDLHNYSFPSLGRNDQFAHSPQNPPNPCG